MPFVIVKVYIVLVSGLAIGLAIVSLDKPALGTHRYFLPPEAKSWTLPFTQIEAKVSLIKSSGAKTLKVFWEQKVSLLILTVTILESNTLNSGFATVLFGLNEPTLEDQIYLAFGKALLANSGNWSPIHTVVSAFVVIG